MIDPVLLVEDVQIGGGGLLFGEKSNAQGVKHRARKAHLQSASPFLPPVANGKSETCRERPKFKNLSPRLEDVCKIQGQNFNTE